MLIVVVQASLAPCQVEVPESVENRSRKGALYFRPASSLELTDEEFEYLRQKRPDIVKKLVVHKPIVKKKTEPKQETSSEGQQQGIEVVPAPEDQQTPMPTQPVSEPAQPTSEQPASTLTAPKPEEHH